MLFVFRNYFFTVSHNHKPLPWAVLYKHNKTEMQGGVPQKTPRAPLLEMATSGGLMSTGWKQSSSLAPAAQVH